VSEQELKRFPTFQAELAAAANEALERFRGEGKKTTLRLVDMESSYLTGFLPETTSRSGESWKSCPLKCRSICRRSFQENCIKCVVLYRTGGRHAQEHNSKGCCLLSGQTSKTVVT
jgi:hypothetical protein